MKYTKLPHTDIKVSKLCLGTMTWGNQNTQAEGFEQMDYALDQGVNFFDTAELYPVPATKETYAETERIIGNWFEKTGHRDKVVLASKIAPKLVQNLIIFGSNFGSLLFGVLELSGCFLGAILGLLRLSWEASGPKNFKKLMVF